MTVQMQLERQSRPRGTAAARRALRVGAVSAGVLLGSCAAAAVGAPPEGWDNAVNDSMLVSLLKLLGIPLLIMAVITLLTYLPSMVRGGRGTADTDGYFSQHSEWFGGPRTTPEAIETGPAKDETTALGGASARW